MSWGEAGREARERRASDIVFGTTGHCGEARGKTGIRVFSK